MSTNIGINRWSIPAKTAKILLGDLKEDFQIFGANHKKPAETKKSK
jgi:hypothetical protein